MVSRLVVVAQLRYQKGLIRLAAHAYMRHAPPPTLTPPRWLLLPCCPRGALGRGRNGHGGVVERVQGVLPKGDEELVQDLEHGRQDVELDGGLCWGGRWVVDMCLGLGVCWEVGWVV